ncbi:MAG: hypothetical protein HF962_06900 [Sulfurovum sp.]|nr:hypothetical protein [Sulfurovum sp.]
MLSISKDFAPPFKMIEPFFLIGSIFYFLGILFLFFLNPQSGYLDFNIVGWAHWFMLGFVMMIIFGAMAQLVPVVLEVGHFSVDMYYVIWPSLLLGTLLMMLGFLWSPAVLPYGGMLVLISMLVFLVETFMTLKKAERVTLTVKSVLFSNVFLTIAIVIGFLMSLALSGGIYLDLSLWLGVHVVLVLGGYVTLTIIGLSMILIPMFGLSHGFDETAVKRSFDLMVGGVSLYLFSAIVGWSFLRYLALVAMYVSVGFYIFQIWIIYETRARKAHDIYAKSMYVGFGSLSVSTVLGIVTLFSESEQIVLAAAWFLIMGFITFLINGHLYKIIPFLVWFERYSPLVGKEKVPMLHDMLPDKKSKYQFWFSAIGMTIAGIGLLVGNNTMFYGGVSFFTVGAGFMLSSVWFMLSFGKELKNKE